MKTPASAEVEAWFADLANHPLAPVMRRVREIILGADARVSERVQYGTLGFVYKSGLCSFTEIKNRTRVTLMFNAAGQLQGDFPHLEGNKVKHMYFGSLADADAREAELRSIVAAWIAYKK